MGKANYDKDVQILEEKLSSQAPVLVLGAGFSLGTKNGKGQKLPTAETLAHELFDKFLANNKKIDPDYISGYQQDRDDLRKTCDNLRLEGLLEDRNAYLTQRFSNCHCPDNDYHMLLKRYPWRHIFSLNIDDLIEFIYSSLPKKEQPNIHVMGSSTLDCTTAFEVYNPHGFVKESGLGYVFDSSEYHELVATSTWTMQHFADLFLTNHVIFLGTEFQEEDFQIMIQRQLDLVQVRQPFHYFFISPELKNLTLRRTIDRSPNMHYIPWTTKSFLEHIKNQVVAVDDIRRKMRDYGMVFYHEKQQEAMPKLSQHLSKLYHGDPPRPIDFFKKIDIVRPELASKAKRIADKGGHQLVVIAGGPYIGKTCSAIRLGVDLMSQGYEFSTFDLSPRVSAVAYRDLVLEYLRAQPEGSRIAILSEDMSYFYSRVKQILERCPKNISSLIIICTANSEDHNSKKYLLDRWATLDEVFLSEKTSPYPTASAIYDKLEENSHLNKLITYGDNRKERIQYIQQLNDLIEVLYVSQEGRGFVTHFSEWIDQKPDNEHRDGFILLCAFSHLGISNLSVSLFRDILTASGIKVDISAFREDYKDLVQIEDAYLRLRCSRLLWVSAQHHMDKKRILQWIKIAASLLAKNLLEHEESIQNETFQKLIKVKTLQPQIEVPMEDVQNLLLELERVCKHLSYYWVQRGICHRELKYFEEANNALLEASKIRNNTSFHIKHAQAKNYMTWAVWALSEQPYHAAHYLDQGREILETLISEAPDLFYAYSVHTYVDMILRYHKKADIPIQTEDIQMLSILLQRLISNFADSMTDQIVSDFLKYCLPKKRDIAEVATLNSLYQDKLNQNPSAWKNVKNTYDTDDLID